MKFPLILQHVKTDAQHKIRLDLALPLEMGNDVTVHIYPSKQSISGDNLVMAKLLEETAFARNVLSNPAEDVWNDL